MRRDGTWLQLLILAGACACSDLAQESASSSANAPGPVGSSGEARSGTTPARTGASAPSARNADASGAAPSGAVAAAGSGAAGGAAGGGAAGAAAGGAAAGGCSPSAAGAGAAGAVADCKMGAAGSGGAVAGPGPSADGMPLSAAVQAWWAYERPATYDVLEADVNVALRDGVELACSLSRPATGSGAAPGKFPGLLVEYTPYALIVDIMIGEAGFFAKRGYNALVCHVRGTGLSGGTWNHAGAKRDGLDAYDLIEWLATQPFSDGRIGQFGGSYGGFTSYQAAAERPPHLLATAPMIAPGSLYHDVIYPGGIKTTEHGNIDAWPDSAETLSLGRINADAEYAMNRMHETFDAYWQERSMHERVTSIEVPILTIGAWEDPNFRAGTLADIEAGLDKTWAIYGQWPHRSPVALETPCDSCVPDPLPSGVLLAWFDHWVKQVPDVPLPAKPVFVSQEGPAGVGQGFRELTWNPEINDVPTYQLGSDSTLALTAAASEPLTFHEPAEPKAAGGSVTFTSAALATDHVLAGHPVLKLTATLSAADASFYVELLDVNAKGEETLVNDGFLKASHRNSDVKPEPVMPGVATTYTISIRPDHHRFVAGNRVRLRISGGDSMSLVPPSQPVDITIQAGAASALHMPRGF